MKPNNASFYLEKKKEKEKKRNHISLMLLYFTTKIYIYLFSGKKKKKKVGLPGGKCKPRSEIFLNNYKINYNHQTI